MSEEALTPMRALERLRRLSIYVDDTVVECSLVREELHRWAAEIARLRAERENQHKGLCLIGYWLKTGGMADAHFLAGAVQAEVERNAELKAQQDATAARLAQLQEVLKGVEWISVRGGDGEPYLTCPACFADHAFRGDHTAWCPLSAALLDSPAAKETA